MSDHALNDLDERLLQAVQEEVPLVPRPYKALADHVGASEQDVIERLSALRWGTRAVIRQISAIFDSKSLGYQSTLVAARIPAEQLDAAAAVISAHPGVSHNYRRDHAYNLWYTLAVPPDSRLGLQRTARILHQQSGALATRLLPTLKMYKIGVKLDLGGNAGAAKPEAVKHQPVEASDAEPLTEMDKDLIRALQQDLPIQTRPFDLLAAQAGISTETLLEAGTQFIRDKRMRRFSAVLRHRELGFDANAMGVWDVPPEECARFGKIAACFPAVSHCYLRPTYEDWPYSIFTMVHARTREQGNAVLHGIAEATGIARYTALYSTHEYKKARIRYFTGDIEAWEAAHAAAAEAEVLSR
ncbi:MAG TPA: hypothetical protein VLI90_20015 [Tepidisphaeraceae bacterium]|nr:hypothetical protein [Tepidisphaeraceae bacterium]